MSGFLESMHYKLQYVQLSELCTFVEVVNVNNVGLSPTGREFALAMTVGCLLIPSHWYSRDPIHFTVFMPSHKPNQLHTKTSSTQESHLHSEFLFYLGHQLTYVPRFIYTWKSQAMGPIKCFAYKHKFAKCKALDEFYQEEKSVVSFFKGESILLLSDRIS